MSESPSLPTSASFADRHVGPDEGEISAMLQALGPDAPRSLDDLIDEIVPASIRSDAPLAIPAAADEHAALAELRAMFAENEVFRSYLGCGYHGTHTPPVIRRNILENPGWYTQYTPYQAEIAQGRLEALLNFQTMVTELTGLPIANASLLDEATAAAEAMAMLHRIQRGAATRFLVADDCHPQTIEVVKGRAEPLDIDVVVDDPDRMGFDGAFGVLLQYPATDGRVRDLRDTCRLAREAGARVVIAADPLALTLLEPPAALGADVAVGSTQRFGVPLGYGGPHAAYLATREEFTRQVPGRIVGISRDADGRPALRMALQTREQHIRREKATSNICTAQVLLAVIAQAYAVYHGPEGLTAIARRVRTLTRALADGARRLGLEPRHDEIFDTVRLATGGAREAILAAAASRRINLRPVGEDDLCVTLDETVRPEDLDDLLAALAEGAGRTADPAGGLLRAALDSDAAPALARSSSFMRQPVFNSYRSETEMLRYLKRLESRDLSLTTSMIPLGSCTMKLNATAEMLPVTWEEVGAIHPFAPLDQAKGYARLFDELSSYLAAMTGLPAVSLQPNSGASGEYTGLLVIRAHHRRNGQEQRDVCLIPSSAHGTNPASASMAGMTVVVVKCDDQGNVDVADLEAKAAEHSERLAALMVTYPSTHGVFEEEIERICSIVHEHGGQVYMDGANLNAQVGLSRPGDMGADVIHVNLHKTFCIPHGGGGPGMGPICVGAHLADFLPGHPLVKTGGSAGIGAVSAAPWGSASILPISWMYCRMMGPDGLTHATKVALLSANYLAQRLEEHFPVLYRGARDRVAHECILDLRPFERSAGVKVEDVAKRLMDHGFHAPTVSFPVAGTVMVEPTESESKAELDRFIDAMASIRAEIDDIVEGRSDREDNPLRNAPHPASRVTATEWPHPYSREVAAWPTPATREHKFWPAVSRVDNPHGDRNLVCSCPPTSDWS